LQRSADSSPSITDCFESRIVETALENSALGEGSFEWHIFGVRFSFEEYSIAP
jgi:hypothetical protein